MGEMSAGEAIAAAQGDAPAAEAPAAAEDTGAPEAFNFDDAAPGADPADAILSEVLGEGAAEAPAAEAAAEEEAAPAEEAPTAPAEVETPEAVKLRKGFTKLHGERQKVLELQQQARAALASVEGVRSKAERFDALMEGFAKDPAGVLEQLEAAGLKDLQNAVLQGFIDREKSPAEREVAKIRKELAEREAREQQAHRERIAAEWREGIANQVRAAGEAYDLVNTLGLHGQVIDVITTYYERHSERDAKGNVITPAVLSWQDAAKAVEDHHEQRLSASKRYGKRAPAPQDSAATPAKKDAPSAKPTAPAKRAPTSLSSVPVREAPPSKANGLSLDPDLRERQLLAEMGLA